MAEFAQLRPFIYHVTSRENLLRLLRTRSLAPAAELLRRAGQPDLIRTRRATSLSIGVDGDTVMLRVQAPLVEANLDLTPPWRFADFVEFLK